MKQYDREKKLWVASSEPAGKLSKRQLCKGGREHDWILCLPPYTKTDSELGLDKVEEYYRIEDEREDAEIAFDKRLEAIGVKSRLWHGVFGRRRSYICSVCLKRK
jgi:hypothetical protein